MKYHHLIKYITVLIFCLLATSRVLADQATDPRGYWITVDDETGKQLSVVQIYKNDQGNYNGRVYRIMDVNVKGKQQNPKDLCDTCSGTLKDKPFLCMVVIYGMQPSTSDTAVFENGRAFDPRNDSVYHAKMWLDDGGNKLQLRGYIGMPLIGRTETWLRTTTPTGDRNWICQRSVKDSYLRDDWK